MCFLTMENVMTRNILKMSVASVAILLALSVPSFADDAGQAYMK